MAHEMRKRIVTLCAVIVCFAVGTNSQDIRVGEDLEVCNAQVNLWVAQTDISRPYGPEIRKVMDALTSEAILNREGVIMDCVLTDVRELKAVPEGPQRQRSRRRWESDSTKLVPCLTCMAKSKGQYIFTSLPSTSSDKNSTTRTKQVSANAPR